MLRNFLAPIHPDGWRFIAAAAVASAILFALWAPLGWLGLVVTLWCAYFFRDPWRVTPDRPGLVVSPADGRIVAIGPAVPLPELALGAAPMTRIGIFLNVFDVHVNRIPLGGRVAQRRYTKGKFLSANLDKASEENERMALRLAVPEGAAIGVVQIAGLVARRIVCHVIEGQETVTGQRFGLIRFGSRVDVYLPPDWPVLAIVGQRVIGGETVLADRRADEKRRQGMVH